MPELDRALADIVEIRARLAQNQTFLGLGPAALAATGLLALALALAQATVGAGATAPLAFFTAWIALAAVSLALLGSEMLRRARRRHGRLADQMILAAMFHFVPAGVAGAALFAFFSVAAPAQFWLVPGLWQVLVSLGIFAAARTLPRGTTLVGGWYLLSGIAVLLFTSQSQSLSPWSMGLPFGIGQLGMALIIHHSSERPHA